MVYNQGSGWTVVFGDHRAEKEITALANDVRAISCVLSRCSSFMGPSWSMRRMSNICRGNFGKYACEDGMELPGCLSGSAWQKTGGVARLRQKDTSDAAGSNRSSVETGKGARPIMKTVREIGKKWLQDKSFRKAYDALEDEYALAKALIEARARAGLSQKELAERMGSSQPFVARMESGKQLPSSATLLKLAEATGTKLRISFI